MINVSSDIPVSFNIHRFIDHHNTEHCLRKEDGMDFINDQKGVKRCFSLPNLDMVEDEEEETCVLNNNIQIVSFTRRECDVVTLTGGKGSSLGILDSLIV